jgi:hypothetical protein
MPAIKLNVSLDADTATKLKRRAREKNLPTSRYLAELIEADDRAVIDALAEEGYRLLSEDTRKVAELFMPLALETLPPWDDWDAEDSETESDAKAG